MNKVILNHPNGTTLSQSLINVANTIYVFESEYNLDKGTIMIPQNCILKFNGGILRNGILHGDHTNISAEYYQIFEDIELTGLYNANDGYGKVEWFGCFPDKWDKNHDFKDAYLAVSTCFPVIKLQKGQYVGWKGEINIGSIKNPQGQEIACRLIGDGINTSEILLNISVENKYKYGFCLGYYNGVYEQRTTGGGIENIRLSFDFNRKIYGFNGVVVGAISRGFLRNVIIYQYNPVSTLTESELKYLINEYVDKGLNIDTNRLNICIAFKGDSELVQIDSCTTYGDIGVGFLTFTDYNSITNSILALEDYGFSSVYFGKSSSNVYINNISLNKGAYGLFIDNDIDMTDHNKMWNFSMNNCRIEQLLSTIKDNEGYVKGGSIFIGKLVRAGQMIFNNIMYGDSSNGIIINNNTMYGGRIILNNSTIHEDPNIKKYIHIFGTKNDNNGIFPYVYMNYHPKSYLHGIDSDHTIKLLNKNIKLFNPIEQNIAKGDIPISLFDHLVVFPYFRDNTTRVKESIEGLRAIDDYIYLSPRMPTSGYYFLQGYTKDNIAKSTFVGIICDIFFIKDNTYESAKIFLSKTKISVIQSNNNISFIQSPVSPDIIIPTNKLIIIYELGKFAYMINNYSTKINVRIKIECLFNSSNVIE